MQQLHNQVVFEPISINKMNNIERKITTESLIFLNENRDKTIKDRMCANGSTKRASILSEETTSPTVESEAIINTGVIDTKHKGYAMRLDIKMSLCKNRLYFMETILLRY